MDATQQKGSPKQLRGRSLGTKLSEAEYAQCEKSAARRGQTLSEWCRQALLDAVAGPAPRPEAEVILSEILALRKIVINLLYGDKAGEPLSEERMRELIEACGLTEAPATTIRLIFAYPNAYPNAGERAKKRGSSRHKPIGNKGFARRNGLASGAKGRRFESYRAHQISDCPARRHG